MRVPVPNPCNARPTSSIVMVGAVPATTRPARKNHGPDNNDHVGPRRSHTLPDSTVAATLATRNAVNGHE